MENCLFCKILNGEIPNYTIHETKNTLAFLDIAGDHMGHTLVVPKQHSTNLLDATQDTLACCISDVQEIANRYTKDLGFSGVQIVINNGESAGQSVFHLHIHILPTGSPSAINLPSSAKDFEQIQKLLRF